MQIKPSNPWEGSFENLTTTAAKPVKKAVTEAVKITAEEVKRQLFGEKPPAEVPAEEQQKIKAEEQKNAIEMKRRMAEMEAAIKKAREERLKREQESVKVKEQEKQEKKAVEQKKREPIWQKAMNMGSQSEKRVNAGG